MTTPVELRTERLLLRPLARDDIADIVRLAGEFAVAATTGLIPHPYTEADAESFFANVEARAAEGTAAVFAITCGGEFCGVVGLHPEPQHQRAELGYWIGVPYWGRGYATEAARAVVRHGFETLRLRRIFAGYFRGNDASRRVLEKIGMKHEGCQRKHVERFGNFMDLELYAILAEEWRP